MPSFSPRVMMKGSITNGSSECGHNRFLTVFSWLERIRRLITVSVDSPSQTLECSIHWTRTFSEDMRRIWWELYCLVYSCCFRWAESADVSLTPTDLIWSFPHPRCLPDRKWSRIFWRVQQTWERFHPKWTPNYLVFVIHRLRWKAAPRSTIDLVPFQDGPSTYGKH